MKLEHGTFPDAAEDALTPGQVREWTGDSTFGSQVIPKGWKRSWNAPICERCWTNRQGFRQPSRVRADDDVQRRGGAHTCAFCGRPTWARIWTRANPLDVPYAPLEEPEPQEMP